jgi:hypothetical protein
MSGPIVRTGPTPTFSKNWENIFGDTKKAAKAKPAKANAKKAGTKAKAAAKPAKKAAKKKKK